MPNRLTQHMIRQAAVEVLYNLEMRSEVLLSDVFDFVLGEIGAGDGPLPEFLRQLVVGTHSNQVAIDRAILKFLRSDWPISRLTVVDRTILRLGAYEILHTDTPDIVAVDEAINLTHDFSDEMAINLINGVLTNLVKK